MSDDLAGGSFRRGEIGLHEIPSIDRFLFWDPLLSLRFHQKRPRGSTPYSKGFMRLEARERPTDPAPQFERIRVLPDRFGNLGEHLLGTSHPAFPLGPIAHGLGHFFAAITYRR